MLYALVISVVLSAIMYYTAKNAQASVPSSEWRGEQFQGDGDGARQLDEQIEAAEKKAAWFENAARLCYGATAVILIATAFSYPQVFNWLLATFNNLFRSSSNF